MISVFNNCYKSHSIKRISSDTKFMDYSMFKFVGKNNFEPRKYKCSLSLSVLMFGILSRTKFQGQWMCKKKIVPKREINKLDITSFKRWIYLFSRRLCMLKLQRKLEIF
jgi:hypothetical protein